MFKKIDLKEQDTIVNFCYPLSKNTTMTSYPLRKSLEDLEHSLSKAIQHPIDEVLGYYQAHQLTGIVVLFVDKDADYLQISTYCRSHYEQMMDNLLRYLNDNYPHYTIYIGYPKQNICAINYLDTHHYPCLSSSNDLRLKPQIFSCNTTELLPINRLTQEQFPSYKAFHDYHSDGSEYWNSSRIYQNFDSCMIYTYSEYNKILGSIFLRKAGADGLEVFSLLVSSVPNKDKIIKSLLGASITNLLKTVPHINEIIYFIEDQDKLTYEVAISLGFTLKSGYCCYNLTTYTQANAVQ